MVDRRQRPCALPLPSSAWTTLAWTHLIFTEHSHYDTFHSTSQLLSLSQLRDIILCGLDYSSLVSVAVGANSKCQLSETLRMYIQAFCYSSPPLRQVHSYASSQRGYTEPPSSSPLVNRGEPFPIPKESQFRFIGCFCHREMEGAFTIYKSVFSREGLNCLGLPKNVFGSWSPGKGFGGKFKWWGWTSLGWRTSDAFLATLMSLKDFAVHGW